LGKKRGFPQRKTGRELSKKLPTVLKRLDGKSFGGKSACFLEKMRFPQLPQALLLLLIYLNNLL
jgi:hypothetical protein